MARTSLPTWYKLDPDEPIPKTTTQEYLEAGCKVEAKTRTVVKKTLNFLSYSMNTFRFNMLEDGKRKSKYEMMSTYRRDYNPSTPPICKLKEVEEPDPLFNRKPLNDFEFLRGNPSKFLDDHFTNISPIRKKINFFRQLKNRHFEFAFET